MASVGSMASVGNMASVLLFCCLLWYSGPLTPVTADKSYSGHQVIRIVPETTEQLDYLQSLMRKMDYPDSGVDIWQSAVSVGQPVDLCVAPNQLRKINRSLTKQNMTSLSFIHDIQPLIHRSRRSASNSSHSSSFTATADFDLGVYHRLAEINTWMDDMVTEHPEVATKVDIGLSTEGRIIHGLKIKSPDSTEDKPAVFIMGGIHAREWITPATVIFIITEMVRQYEEADPDVTDILNAYDWYFVPSINPDGYEYTWTDDRLWRKTRSGPRCGGFWGGGCCYGVDPNRNFPFEWGRAGSSSSVCSSTYRGPNELSEPEILGLTQFVETLAETPTGVAMFVDIHSYGQLLMTPWGYTEELPSDYDNMIAVADAGAAAIQGINGVTYETGPGASTLYLVSGGSNDWAYGQLGVMYSYLFELRDEGQFGFLLPQEQIIPTATEIMAALIEMAKRLTL